jgi:hypothetical protein
MQFIVISASFPLADGRRLDTKWPAIRPIIAVRTALNEGCGLWLSFGLAQEMFRDGALGLAFDLKWCFNFCGRLAGFLIPSRQVRREYERRV